MKLFLVNSRKHLNSNNKSVVEGLPYGFAKSKDIEHNRSAMPELKMTNYTSTKKKFFKYQVRTIIPNEHINNLRTLLKN